MTKQFLSLDVGTKRTGLALADSDVRLAYPVATLEMGDDIFQNICQIVAERKIDSVIVGYPRNQSGEPTAQTAEIENFVESLKTYIDCPIIFQDESLTSVEAEARLSARQTKITRSDIDAEAASIILQDYLEQNHAR